MKRTYLDSSVLIEIGGGKEKTELATALLNDPSREMVSSAFVALEVYPQAHHNKRTHEIQAYDAFFDNLALYVKATEPLLLAALDECRHVQGLAPMDALHLAAAAEAACDEFVTTESETKPMFKSRLVKVRRLV